MFKKGQGSLEYLIILAAVIAVAAIVVFYMMSVVDTQQPEAIRTSQKATCSTNKGIELPTYTARFPVNASDAADWIIVNYGGEQMKCDNSTDILDNIKASCEIGDPDRKMIPLQVNATHCRFIIK